MEMRALASWFGSNRLLASHVGEELAGCRWIGVVFAGGMSELLHIDAPTIVANDLHRWIVNLARIVADDPARARLIRRLRNQPFADEILAESQTWCKCHEPGTVTNEDAAFHYFVCVWMGRSHKAGTSDEFNGRLSTRWNANGGDSNTRYRSALRSLAEWGRIMRRCNLTDMDFRAFLDRCEDWEGNGLYADPPFPGPGDKYRHTLSDTDHRELAERLAGFESARVVCRFYDVPLVRDLYPERLGWTWRRLTGRKQTNGDAPEVLIINGPSCAKSESGRLF